ncbi:group II intron reverse transcriptase/maturase [Dongshaea marina]|uniref:group II intron reverse transcriptase/maturase n=1 Tax=Dongshaea marina TaxID=2047966 RepID=UPI001F39EC0D|nr:group II intron reverse transcriptase/maturase [Dongshaea marina]
MEPYVLGKLLPPAVKAVAIPKKSGGERLLGIPTVSDRIAQMVVKLELEPCIEPYFLDDSYGYRPNKSALDAVGITRKRCWEYDWLLEFDIKGLFDNISHELMMRAVEKHTESTWVRLYVRRWLTAQMQMPDNSLVHRNQGTPQGGVISPLLANLFLHYVFDKWLQKHYSHLKWCRFADDGLVHCNSKVEAEMMLNILTERFRECGLELHPVKTKIVYCKDGSRQGQHEHTAFDFLGYTFRCRKSINRWTKQVFSGFGPAISKQSTLSIGEKLRKLRFRTRTDLELKDLAKLLNPMIQGWLMYYGKYYRSAMYAVCRLINNGLITWARRKYKSLSHRSRTRASELMKRIAKQSPGLFAHWRAGMVGAFV